MRRFIFLAGAILLVLMMLGIASGAAIAKTGPFLPGSPLFPVQNISEQTQARLQSPVERQTEAYFLLTERRIENLIAQTSTIHEAESLAHLSAALDQAVLSWSQLPADKADSLRDQVLFMLKASEIAANQLTVAPTQNPGLVAAVLAKISTLQSLAEASEADPTLLASLVEVSISSLPEEISEQANLPDATIDPLVVPFPAGSVASEHAFFPLTGQHAQIECEACHSDGIYEGTATYCEACHAGIKPDPHYIGDCAACHSAFSWSDISLDHTLVAASECVSCHQADKPANHFGNQCGACHSTATWDGASFSHQAAGATDCQSCHANDKPTNHFNGQCSACHTTNTWSGASFNHQAVGATNCKSCHSGDKPNNHFSGQCSACHSTNSWKGASFSHNGQTNCKSCHSSDKPNNHYGGQCSTCHNTNTWSGASFSHSGQTNCKSCHSSDKPNNHYGGQCSACHSTNSWSGASFSHKGQTDCKSCHSSDKPNNHYGGQCSACHNTNNWDAEFSHNGQTNCKSCHAGDRPNEHDNGQCSECHNTSDWDDADEDDDEDDDEDEDDENGSLDSTPITVAAGFHAFQDCATCHQPGQTNTETPQSGTSSWWQAILALWELAG